MNKLHSWPESIYVGNEFYVQIFWILLNLNNFMFKFLLSICKFSTKFRLILLIWMILFFLRLAFNCKYNTQYKSSLCLILIHFWCYTKFYPFFSSNLIYFKLCFRQKSFLLNIQWPWQWLQISWKRIYNKSKMCIK